jgi:hypothetical protein
MSSPAYGPAAGIIDQFRKIPEGVENAVDKVPGASRFAQFFFPPQQQQAPADPWHAQMVADANESHRRAVAAEAFKQAALAKNQRAQAQPMNRGE